MNNTELNYQKNPRMPKQEETIIHILDQIAPCGKPQAIAEEEGFPAIAAVFRNVATVEEQHEIRYRKLLAHVEAGDVFSRDEEIFWQCRNCGYVHKGKTAPESCPACAHPQAYFEPMKQNY